MLAEVLRGCGAILTAPHVTAEDRARALFNRGRALADQGDFDRAIADYTEFLRLKPDSGRFEPVAGFSQFGLPRDDRGNRFPSW